MRKAVWMWGRAAQEPEVLKSPGGVPTGFTSVPRGSLLPSRSEFVLGKGTQQTLLSNDLVPLKSQENRLPCKPPMFIGVTLLSRRCLTRHPWF